MHWYKKNIGDYHKKAGRLSMLEHGAYTLLMDSCYDRERFPTEDDAFDWCWARTDEEKAAVRFVLSKFFTLVDGKYVQLRIQEEVEAYHEKASKNADIARNREQKRTNRARIVYESLPEQHESSPNQEPITSNQEPITNNQKNTPQAASRAKKTKIPADFDLTDDRLNAARNYWSTKNRDDLNATDEFAKFVNHHKAHGKAMADWDAAWRTWYTNAIQFTKQVAAKDGRPYADRFLETYTDTSWADGLQTQGE